MLAGMREIDPGADVAPLDCSKVSKDDVGNPVAAGSVALLLADRVGSTPWEEAMAANLMSDGAELRRQQRGAERGQRIGLSPIGEPAHIRRPSRRRAL